MPPKMPPALDLVEKPPQRTKNRSYSPARNARQVFFAVSDLPGPASGDLGAQGTNLPQASPTIFPRGDGASTELNPGLGSHAARS